MITIDISSDGMGINVIDKRKLAQAVYEFLKKSKYHTLLVQDDPNTGELVPSMASAAVNQMEPAILILDVRLPEQAREVKKGLKVSPLVIG